MVSYDFFLNASQNFLNSYQEAEGDDKNYYIFASILFSWTALESYTNMRSERLSHGDIIKPHEKAFLLEKELKVGDDGQFGEIDIHPATSKKIVFLIAHFSKVKVNTFKNKFWRDMRDFEDLRNRIVHHKEENLQAVNINRAIKYKNFAFDLIDYLNKKI